MTVLIIFGVLLLWWVAGAIYAARVARARNLQRQPTMLSAIFSGPFWVREMLIWSTLPARNPVSQAPVADSKDRVRLADKIGPAPVGAPATGAISAIKADQDAEQLSAQWKPGAASTLDEATGNAAPPLPGVIPVPVPAPDPEATSNPAPLGPPSLEDLPEPIVIPAPAPAAGRATPVGPATKKLPKQPKRKGKVKAPCPWCDKKQKFAADAICPSCSKINPWLAQAWGLDPAGPVVQPEVVAPQPPAKAPPQTPMEFMDSPLGPVPVVNPGSAEPVVETAQILLSPDAVKPKRLPGKPVFGSSVKALCPWCNTKKPYHKDAVCPACNNPNPWLIEKWKIKQAAAPQEPQAAQSSPPALLQYPHVLPGSESDSPAPTITDSVPASEVSHPAPPLPEVAPEPEATHPAPPIPAQVPVADTPVPPSIPSIPEPSPQPDQSAVEPIPAPMPKIPAPHPVVTPTPEPTPGAEAPAVPGQPDAAAAANPVDGKCIGCGRVFMADLYGGCMFCGAPGGEGK